MATISTVLTQILVAEVICGPIEAILEIVDHFGAASYETQKVEGHWRHGGVIYRVDLE